MKKLLEPSPRFSDSQTSGQLRITTVGAYTAHELPRKFTYVDAVIVDTPIVDAKIKAKVGDSRTVHERLARCEVFRAYLDNQWESLADKNVAYDWKSVSRDLGEDIRNILSKI